MPCLRSRHTHELRCCELSVAAASRRMLDSRSCALARPPWLVYVKVTSMPAAQFHSLTMAMIRVSISCTKGPVLMPQHPEGQKTGHPRIASLVHKAHQLICLGISSPATIWERRSCQTRRSNEHVDPQISASEARGRPTSWPPSRSTSLAGRLSLCNSRSRGRSRSSVVARLCPFPIGPQIPTKAGGRSLSAPIRLHSCSESRPTATAARAACRPETPDSPWNTVRPWLPRLWQCKPAEVRGVCAGQNHHVPQARVGPWWVCQRFLCPERTK